MATEQVSAIVGIPRETEPLDEEPLGRYLALSPQERADIPDQGVELVAAARRRGVEPMELARTILAVLDDRAWGRELIGERSPRRQLVEQLLELGYPWALSVHPGDLEWTRQEQRRGSRTVADHVRVAVWGFWLGLLASQLAPYLPF